MTCNVYLCELFSLRFVKQNHLLNINEDRMPHQRQANVNMKNFIHISKKRLHK